jgi:pimeloyl-ACP methyl ester carboxylesterase
MPKVKIQGVSLDYQIHGRGVPLVMLHGFGGGHRGWFFQTRAFKRFYQIVTVDDGDLGERFIGSNAVITRTFDPIKVSKHDQEIAPDSKLDTLTSYHVVQG